MTTDVVFLLPAYNPSDEALGVTIASLLDQTMPTDIVIVDDGSTIPIADRVPADPSITVVRMEKNGGITRALNRGLETILPLGYRYVARIDCGDICDPTRIEKQFAYMEAHPAIDLLGTPACVVTPEGATLYVVGDGADGPERMTRKLRNNPPLLHPTFFFRTSLIERIGPYSTDYPAAEDYEFMLRTDNGRNIACLNDVLLTCVADPKGISLRNRNRQIRTRLKAQMRYFRPLQIGSHIGLIRTLTIWAIPLRIWLPLKRTLKSLG